jgi:hypothetical protein
MSTALQDWLPTGFDTEPRTPDRLLTGFRIGQDLARYKPNARPYSWEAMGNAIALPYNAGLCARGLDRWEDDGGAA